MKSFMEYITLNEASIKRLENHLNRGEPIAIVSAEREDWDRNDYQNNRVLCKRYTKELRMLVLQQKFGFNKVRGGFIETDSQDKNKKVEKESEHSTLIFSTPEREDELKKLVIGLGKRYKQDSVLFVDTSGNAFLIDTRDNFGAIEKLGKYTTNILSMFYTKIKGKKFSFEPQTDVSESIEISEAINNFTEFSKTTGIPTTIQMRYMNKYFGDLSNKSLEETVKLVESFKF